MEKIFIKLLFLVSFLLVIVVAASNKVENTSGRKENYVELDSSYAAYFPLAIGNSFTYLKTSTAIPPITPYKIKAKITKDTIMGGKRYFYCSNFPFIGSGWVRFDTATGNLLLRTTSSGCSQYPNDLIMDSLRSKINDQISCTFSFWYTRKCTDTSSVTIFNTTIKSKYFLHDGLMYGYSRYAKNIGMTYECSGEPPPCLDFYDLKGCVVNGILYGDTSLTDVRNISVEVPEQSMLYLNYPNPFNPVTRIKFNLKEDGKRNTQDVKLTVYDILGKEIKTLVNEELQEGTYEVTFDGSNLPGGVYFYRLTAGTYNETKKMLLNK